MSIVGVSTHSRLKAAGNRVPSACCLKVVSTHSRLKAAGTIAPVYDEDGNVSTHSRLKAAGKSSSGWYKTTVVSTHSRLKASGQNGLVVYAGFCSFNTQPPKGGWARIITIYSSGVRFQHTAA